MPNHRFVAPGAFISYLVIIMVSGTNSATAASIFEKMNEILMRNEIPWANCVGVSVDNTSVNLGKSNSIFTRAKEQNPDIYFMGCPCHIIHNTCMKAAEKFSQVCFCMAHVWACIICMKACILSDNIIMYENFTCRPHALMLKK